MIGRMRAAARKPFLGQALRGGGILFGELHAVGVSVGTPLGRRRGRRRGDRVGARGP